MATSSNASSSGLPSNSSTPSSSSNRTKDPLVEAGLLVGDIKETVEYVQNHKFPYCDDVVKYEKIEKIGEGTFGEVFKARDRKDVTKIVALKRIRMDSEKEGFPLSALRELKILQSVHHENIVNLIEVCCSKPHPTTFAISTYLVFEFCEHDLTGLLSNPNVKFTLGEIKKLMQQLLNGLHYLHAHKILHRDLKTCNILVTKSGCIKVADFGLSRAFSTPEQGKPNRYTNRVVTIWYRPPELLLGERNYGPSVDMWGFGCIMAEMWTRSPIMQGSSEINQLTLISNLCGTITTDVWPDVDKLELFGKFELPQNQKRKVRERVQHYVKDPYAFGVATSASADERSFTSKQRGVQSHCFECNLEGPFTLLLSSKIAKCRSKTRKTEKSTKVAAGLLVADIKETVEYVQNYKFPYCDDVVKYEKIEKIGESSFGEIFKARDKKDVTKVVTLKRVLSGKEKVEGFPITALRELQILQSVKHDNIINFIEVCCSKPHPTTFAISTYLVFEFCEHDLSGLLSNPNVKFTLGEIKKVMQQLLDGLHYLHSNKIVHRDMKTSNILVTKSGRIKLSGFSLSRAISVSDPEKPNSYTNRVVTLWYRPPELLLGERNYGSSVDMWGVGCIMAEMWTRSPIMQGNSEINQLTLISKLCGSITTDVWPDVDKLELFGNFELPQNQERKIPERLKDYVKDPYARDLLDKLLMLDPKKRADSDTALNHDLFWNDPLPTDLTKNLAKYTQSMFEYKEPPRTGSRGEKKAVHSQEKAQAKP
ncbi:Hypothetical predicted protein [Cloeon dipterum]|uniref:Protein kinase domain-containing protein n=1 Tax=Cloeon dipterum TaxID=197152 RepID=A0A8S1D893_9INSE|nr:Hypothetical predicted protein [Cloeon dipterum]